MINIMKEWAYSGGIKRAFAKVFKFAKDKGLDKLEELKRRYKKWKK